ncbi:hypothetical protein BOX15_Mlig009360g1, partial [Macrostomum lignano]
KRWSNWLSSTLMADDSSSPSAATAAAAQAADDVLGSVSVAGSNPSADYSSSGGGGSGSNPWQSEAQPSAVRCRAILAAYESAFGETPPPSAAGREVEADNAEAEAEQLLAACRLADEVLQESWSVHRRSVRSPYLPVLSRDRLRRLTSRLRELTSLARLLTAAQPAVARIEAELRSAAENQQVLVTLLFSRKLH